MELETMLKVAAFIYISESILKYTAILTMLIIRICAGETQNTGN